MTIAYVAGPYRAASPYEISRNIERARQVAADLWTQGYAVICPHLNSALFDGLCPDERFLAGDLEIMRRCDLVVLVPGWERSAGTRAEVVEAARVGLPIFAWTPGGLDPLAQLHRPALPNSLGR